MRRFLNNRISNYNNVGDRVDDFCEDCENRWLPFSRVWWDSTEKNIADIKRKDNGIFVIKKILSLINSISESIKDIYDRINAIESPILSVKLLELENDYLEVGVTADGKQEDLNIAIYENYINLKNTKVDKPLIESTSDSLKIVALDHQGESVFIKSNELGKVKSVNNKIGDVILKTSDLENNSDYTTNATLTAHTSNKSNPHNVTKSQIGLGNVDNTSDLNKPISTAAQTELNKKLDKPTTNNTNQFVILGDGSTAPKSDFGKVDTVNNLAPDVNRNINIGLKEVLSINNEDLTQSINVRILKTTSSLEEDVYENRPTSLSLGYSMTGFTTIDNIKYTTDGSIIDFSDDRTGRSLMLLPDTLKYQNVTLVLPTEKSGVLALTSDIKIKTINNQEPDAQGNIDLEKNEFVKNGKGWSLKYRVDNQSFYGVIGDKAIDVSYTTSANTNVNFPYGAIGMYSFTAGYKNSVLGLGSTVLGASNSSSGQTNHIIGYKSIITEDRGTGNVGKHSNGIFAGEGNAINNNIHSIIVGGNSNKIVGNPDAKSGAFSKANVIMGGWNNEIFSSSETNRPAYSSFIIGGELNKAQGYYNIVGGYSNHAVTAGETLFGFYGTVQNTSLNGNDYIENSRMFNVGVGLSLSNGTIIRRDGLSVYRNGLVTAPSLTNELIDSEKTGKVLITKEYLNPAILINILTSASAKQINQIKTLLGI